MEVQQDANVVYRCVPLENMEINKWWLCDEGRFNYHYVNDSKRINIPVHQNGGLAPTNWTTAMGSARSALRSGVPRAAG